MEMQQYKARQEKLGGFKRMPEFSLVWYDETKARFSTGLFLKEGGGSWSVKLTKTIPANTYINLYRVEPKKE